MAPSVRELYQQLSDHGLMSVDEMRSRQSKLSPSDLDAELSWKFLEGLVEEDRVTPYQAKRLYEGRAQAISLGRYVILDELGQGGMGVVYKALHPRMQRMVALKVLPAALMSTPQAVERFQREVHAVARLSHPNIVAAHDADEVDGVHFLVMEYIAGKDLARWVRDQGPLSVGDAVNCVLQAARGLEHAHSRGIIHRDLKPSNLLRDGEGVVKIADLGLARLGFEEGIPGCGSVSGGLTRTGMMMGTIDFMAPEQALDSEHAGQRADIYSLGCTLFYLLAGDSPYQGPSALHRLLAHREQPIPSLPQLRKDVPASLQSVFCRMVAKRPDERIGSARELIDALSDIGRPTDGAAASVPGGRVAVSDLSADRADGIPAAIAMPLPADSRPGVVGAMSPMPARGVMHGQAPAVRSGRRRFVLGLLGGGFVAAGVVLAAVLRNAPARFPPSSRSREPEAPQSSASLALSPDELAARWALGHGAQIEIENGQGERVSITAAGDLPVGPFTVTKLSFVETRARAALPNAQGALVHVVELHGQPRAIPPAEWPHLGELWRLEELRLDMTNAGTTALEQVGKLRNLNSLSLGMTAVSDGDLRYLVGLRNLVSLTLYRTDTSDTGLAFLAGFPLMQQLNLSDTRVSDEGLSQLQGLYELRGLQLQRTRVTGSGLRYLHRLPRLWYLSLNGTPLVAAELSSLVGITGLTHLELQGTMLDDEAIEPLKRLAELPNFKQVDLRGTRISPAGLSALASHLRGCQVLGAQLPTSPAGSGP